MLQLRVCSRSRCSRCKGSDVELAQPVKNQMVKGVVKPWINARIFCNLDEQKVKNEFVDRELSILDDTEIVLKIGSETKSGVGKSALKLLEGREGASVQVKCDKDVNVLKVTVTLKK